MYYILGIIQMETSFLIKNNLTSYYMRVVSEQWIEKLEKVSIIGFHSVENSLKELQLRLHASNPM